MSKWQHSGISRKEALEILASRKASLREEWKRNYLHIKEILLSGSGESNRGDPVDQIRNDLQALTKKQQGCVKCLDKIVDARKRIFYGSFGICEACGEEIPLGRLQIRPESPVCAFCKTKQEREENVIKHPTKTFFFPALAV